MAKSYRLEALFKTAHYGAHRQAQVVAPGSNTLDGFTVMGCTQWRGHGARHDGMVGICDLVGANPGSLLEPTLHRCLRIRSSADWAKTAINTPGIAKQVHGFGYIIML
ncbi:hypothetical protein CCU68_31995 [Pseudomonas gingeri NCPPB 3146 = LMG 5327]|uniref:Uncharacterized protein n=1 Tax=Pseudomonas gingeri NCPPB 3146 = LMG 5327 TaxID=707248 RepID=A0ABX4XUD9_9PSED|nr:hypothetical protein CCU68_31995 [Pseudomonas gingeri NCPPB 3146 = LMG 5327]